MSFTDIEGIRPAVNNLYLMPRPVIGCAASAMVCIASIRSRDFRAMPRPFLIPCFKILGHRSSVRSPRRRLRATDGGRNRAAQIHGELPLLLIAPSRPTPSVLLLLQPLE